MVTNVPFLLEKKEDPTGMSTESLTHSLIAQNHGYFLLTNTTVLLVAPFRDEGGIPSLRAHCALLLDYVPPEEPLGTPFGNPPGIR